ncbi:MAG: ZIP family metal transporter, partial [Candidatus Aenigmatarchaeota archaeon]
MLNEVFFYAFGSVMFASFISLVGIFTISMKEENLTKILLYLVAFSTGALLGGAFFHLLPECFEKIGFGLNVSISILFGIVVFFVLEKMIHWRHCHIPTSEKHPHPFAYMNLIGDGIHNFIDGLIIGGAYIVNFELGIITT